MKAGIFGLLDSTPTTVEKTAGTTTQNGIEYQYCIQPERTFNPPQLNKSVQTGQAALEVPEEIQQTTINDGKITTETTITTQTKHTEWFLIPDELLVIENSDGHFLYDLMMSEYGWEANRAQLDLTSMRSDYDDAHLWQAGFYDRLGTAQKGVVYGEDVLDDQEIGNPLKNAQINQLGLEYERDGEKFKITLTESGYIELYQPSEFNTEDFATYLQNEIRDYIMGIYTEDSA